MIHCNIMQIFIYISKAVNEKQKVPLPDHKATYFHDFDENQIKDNVLDCSGLRITDQANILGND